MKKCGSRQLLLAVLLVILAFNYVDRLALGLLLQNIKTDLGLSDTQLGVLSGIAFALFYSVMGLPIARWADRGNRITIIALTTALWSMGVALCGLARSFAQLLLVRVVVAVGEAGCVPPAHSLIADYFSRAERPRAVGVYMLGAPLSVVIGYFVAGWLNEYYGWRWTFAVLGLPGFALCVLVLLLLREPRLGYLSAREGVRAQPSRHTGYWEVFITLWHNTTFRNLLLCFSVVNFFGYGIIQWQPAFFVRSFGLRTGELGTWFAVTYGATGIAGTWLGGMLASRYAAGNERLQLRVISFAYIAFGAASAAIYLSPNYPVALVFMGVSAFGGTLAIGPLFATIQTLVPDRMRATSIALMYLFANLIGMGLGPLATGMLSDRLQPMVGTESLRYALLILSPGYLWGAWYARRASSTVAGDLITVEREVVQYGNGTAMPHVGRKSSALP